MHNSVPTIGGTALLEILNQSTHPTAIFIGPEFAIQLANPDILKFWKKDASIVGKTYQEVFPEIENQHFLDMLNQVWNTKQPYTHKDPENLFDSNGDIVNSHSDLIYKPIFDSEGNIICILHTVADVTERVSALKFLRKKEQRERYLYSKLHTGGQYYDIDQSPTAIMLLEGENLLVSHINSKMLELMGRDDIKIDKPLLEQIPETKDQIASQKFVEILKYGSTFSASAVLVETIRQGKLNEMYFNLTYSPYFEGEIITGVVATAVDVTAQILVSLEKDRIIHEKTLLEKTLRNSEQRLQGILETMAEGVGIIDKSGQLIYANPMAQQILGLTLSEIESRTYDDPLWQNLRLDGTALPQEEHPMSIMMSTGRKVFDVEIGVQPPDKDRFYISINAAPIFDENGNLTGGIGTFMDVTSRRLITQGKDDFISIASHELKTPVTSLKASLQMLQKSHNRLPEESRDKLISQSLRSLKNLSRLINDLLDTSRIEQGQMKIEATSFSIDQLFDDCYSHIGDTSNHEIVFDGDKETVITADSQQLGQVLVNFITNAIKYAPDSGKIVVTATKSADSEIKVTVKDFGPGIADHKLKQLFNRYYRTDYNGQKFTGLGLGLYISAEIIKNHGGKIGVDSEIGRGSEFWFSLPLES